MPNAPKWVLDVIDKIIMPKLPVMEVTNIELLSASVKKIRFCGDFQNFSFHPGSYMDIRVSDTEVRRYTAAAGDAQSGVMDFVVHLHGPHSGNLFMDGLKIGQKINSSMLKAHKCYDASAGKFVVFGDETSLALASSLFSVFEAQNKQFEFYLELDEQNRNVPELLGLKNCSVFPKNGSFKNEDWIRSLPIMQTQHWNGANFILTGNAKSVQIFRKVLKSQTSAKIISHGYWLEGKKGL